MALTDQLPPVWLRLVANLDMRSCWALRATSTNAQSASAGALATIVDARSSAEQDLDRVRMAMECSAVAAAEAAERERAAARAAIEALAPLRNGRLPLHETHGPQIAEIFAELEHRVPAATRFNEGVLEEARVLCEASAVEACKASEAKARDDMVLKYG
eukprot:NODE_21811_length_735_cov_5.100329.p2 GENE.NODE_21811_length_735_cov_5.100329~~NODE_21811_length_735_cov_5.100329.p2  ORF type:complete len:159 (-),score=37.97 NODE_21811_length_735_cov_5.100329:133-609(-)